MREELKKLNGKNRTFIATVGIKGSYLGNDNITHRTVCLENVYLKDSILLTDHVWVSKNNNLKGLIKGQRIQFKGFVTYYYKGGAKNPIRDYCIEYIHKVKIIEEE